MNRASTKITNFIKTQSLALGFDYCGIAKATFLENDAVRLENWLNKNYHGEMAYMANHFDKRLDPRKLMDDCQSVVCVMKNYYHPFEQEVHLPKISKYAYGKDYHKVIKKDLNKLLGDLQKFGEINGRPYVDSAPILERSWAAQSGIGWVGKNGMLLNKKAGSFFFIGVLLLDIPLEYDSPFETDHCGSCTKCITACPTEAILPDKTIVGNKCISYHTIELKSEFISSDKKWDNWMFGCDICQDVCPWNRFSIQHNESRFEPRLDILNTSKEEWLQMNEEAFDILSQASPIRRTKLEGIKRNLTFIKKD